MNFKRNQLVWLETDLFMGPALIIDDEETFKIRFLDSQEIRHYTKKNPPFKRVQFDVGLKLKWQGSAQGAWSEVRKVEQDKGIYTLFTDEGSFEEHEIQKITQDFGVVDLVRQNKFSPLKSFYLRQEALELQSLRETHRLRGAVGCRVQLLPHQLFVLDQALSQFEAHNKIRILLADEVGLGKTIESGLIFSALHARQKLKKVLILVPPALKVQWLTESFRRFNIRFRLDHEELIEESDYRDFIVSSLDEIESNQKNWDLLIVDESHRLINDKERSEALQHLVRRSQHVMFLSATPQLYGVEAFQKMMRVLALPSGSEDSLSQDVVPLMFQSRRSDLGLECYRQLEAVYISQGAKTQWVYDFVERMIQQKHKVFVVGSSQAKVVSLYQDLKTKFGEHFSLFHEGMDLIERDRQAAYFANPEGAQFLISSEIGGEGRNFQFCHNMLLYDLPPDPLVVEQRIGRLDRLGQTQTVHVWCPVVEGGEEEKIFDDLKDQYQVFHRPWTGSGSEDGLIAQDSQGQHLQDAEQGYRKVQYDAQRAQQLIEEAEDLEDVPISYFLERLYDLFGVEHEDFDSQGSWRVFASSLMYVDYFPGLGETGERLLTFDRAQALAREDMSLMTLDHPDFVESMQFLLNSDMGKLCVAMAPQKSPYDIFLWALKDKLEVWSATRKNRSALKLPFYEDMVSWHDKGLPEVIQQALPEILKDCGLHENTEALLVSLPYQE